MTGALLNNYGTKLKSDGKEIFAIWLPEQISDVPEQELRKLKIGYRAKLIKRLPQDFAEGKIDEFKLRTLDQESARRELMKITELDRRPLVFCFLKFAITTILLSILHLGNKRYIPDFSTKSH